MFDGSWWVLTLMGLAMVIVTTVALALLVRGLLRVRGAASPGRLVHAASRLVIGLVTFAVFAALQILAIAAGNKTGTWFSTTVFSAFALLGAHLIATSVFTRHEVSDTGLSFTKLTGARGHIRWDEVQSIRYRKLGRWFRVEARSGEVARISILLVGLSVFARAALEKVRPEAIDKKTIGLLRAAAAGQVAEPLL